MFCKSPRAYNSNNKFILIQDGGVLILLSGSVSFVLWPNISKIKWAGLMLPEVWRFNRFHPS
jgi:hypothetical protein